MTIEAISAPGRPPRGACDCPVHVIDPRFPLPGMPLSAMRDAPATAYQAAQRALGLERTVLVQTNAYGTGNQCMLEAVQVLGPASTRAIEVVRPDATISGLTMLADKGVRGIRFHLLPGGYLTLDNLDGLAARAADLGWHVQPQMDGRDLPQMKLVAGLLNRSHLMAACVKGFGCRPVRDGSDAAVGRRSKASRRGNRGTRERWRRCRDLWGFGGPLARVVRA
jgi:hypothetical protein